MATEHAPTSATPPSGTHRYRIEKSDGGAAKPAESAVPRDDALKSLLRFEAEIRAVPTAEELVYFIANETRRMLSVRQTIVCRVGGRRPQSASKPGEIVPIADLIRVEAVSSVAVIDRNSPAIQWFQDLAATHCNGKNPLQPAQFLASGHTDETEPGKPAPQPGQDPQSYPYPWMLWLPLVNRDGEIFAGLLLAREVIWHQAEIDLAERVAKTYGHAWAAFHPRRLNWLRHLWSTPRNMFVRAGVVLTLLGFAVMPVRLSALAPVETVAADPKIIAAPMDGVIKEVVVSPGAHVTRGQPLVRFDDTVSRNAFQIAEKKVLVASAKLRQSAHGAFDNARAKNEFAIAQSELALAKAERDYSRALLAKSVLTAPADGIVVFGHKKDWAGKPVATGEKIMQLATPENFEFRVDLPVKDAIVLKEGADVSVFLDSDPLHEIKAKINQISFEAQPTAEKVLAYRVFAKAQDMKLARRAARIGHHGTAQLYGQQVPMIFYLLRRPLTALRQSLGL